MTEAQRLKNLTPPTGPVDVVLDTDTFNEIDDQYALSYLLLSGDKLRTKAIYAAPFLNRKVSSPEEGMEKSFEEIGRMLGRLPYAPPVFRGSRTFLADEKTPVLSAAAQDLAERVEHYSPESPLYIVAIGAITDVASAILLNPHVCENAVVVWLGGHARHFHDCREFNLMQDVAAARVVMGCGVPFVQLPCMGVVNTFTLSAPELSAWLVGKNELADDLAAITMREMARGTGQSIWTKVIWDVTAVAWLLNDGDRFMLSRLEQTRLPTYDLHYDEQPLDCQMRYVYYILKDPLLRDLVEKLSRA